MLKIFAGAFGAGEFFIPGEGGALKSREGAPGGRLETTAQALASASLAPPQRGAWASLSPQFIFVVAKVVEKKNHPEKGSERPKHVPRGFYHEKAFYTTLEIVFCLKKSRLGDDSHRR